ncbi:hypothetical protein L3Q67_45240 (plasmid) [Saccharothrix sp. AJ9571]|nr:hypothetical protein L3Q67_45240 [Saccharothrix sp. AJ9571]
MTTSKRFEPYASVWATEDHGLCHLIPRGARGAVLPATSKRDDGRIEVEWMLGSQIRVSIVEPAQLSTVPLKEG